MSEREARAWTVLIFPALIACTLCALVLGGLLFCFWMGQAGCGENKVDPLWCREVKRGQ